MNSLIECIHNGAFGPPGNASIVTPNLRILFPWMQPKDRWVSGFDLTKPNDIQKVREFILPAVLVTEDRSALAINTIRREVERRQLKKDEQVRQKLGINVINRRLLLASLMDKRKSLPMARRYGLAIAATAMKNLCTPAGLQTSCSTSSARTVPRRGA